MINKLKENTIPRFLKGKTHRSMRMVRPIDVNGVIDEVNAEIESLEAQISAIPAGPVISGDKATFTLTEAQIDTLGTVGMELFPAVAGTYYDISKIRVIVDTNGATITYNSALDNYFHFTRNSGTQDLCFLEGTIFTTSTTKVGVVNIANTSYVDMANEIVPALNSVVGQNVWLQLYNGANPTKGGVSTVIPTVTIEVWYDEIAL